MEQHEIIIENTGAKAIDSYESENTIVWLPGQKAIPSSHIHSRSYLLAKRLFDILSSLLLLFVIWPIFLIIAIAVKIDSPGPVFFKHKRIGQHGAEIYLYKFRTMKDRAEEMIQNFSPDQMREWKENYKLDDDPRVTRLGRILRKLSLDELPQIFNIIQGNLSVVGPRPVIADELQNYGVHTQQFLSAKPGLTGYWQAYARSECSYPQRVSMELYYTEHASFLWDVRIIFATLGSVITGKGAK